MQISEHSKRFGTLAKGKTQAFDKIAKHVTATSTESKELTQEHPTPAHAGQRQYQGAAFASTDRGSGHVTSIE